MPEPRTAAATTGHALRWYHALLILALGWAAGRLPDIVQRIGEDRARLSGEVAPAPLAAQARAPDPERLAAEIAVRVAAEVAQRTVSELVAAGWRPVAPAALPGTAPAPVPPPQLIRIVHEAASGRGAPAYSPAWSLGPSPAVPTGRVRDEDVPLAGSPAEGTPAPARRGPTAHALATDGYRGLRAGDRRAAARQFEAALAADPEAPQAGAWAAELAALRRRWGVEAYVLARGPGASDALAAGPVLGGGQAGAELRFIPDPMARRPIAAFARVSSAAGRDGGLDPDSAEAAVGVRWRPLSRVPLALDAERRFALGALSRNAWAGRLSGGAAVEGRVAGRTLLVESWGEGGVVESRGGIDLYAGGQVRGATPLATLGRMTIDAGAGAWGAGQRSFGETSSRLDLGPSTRIRLGDWPVSAQIDYRVRVAGDAEPGTGPAVTVSGSF